MKKILLAWVLVMTLLIPQAAMGAEELEEQQVKQMVGTYFDLRYSILSKLVYNPQIRELMDPDMLAAREAVNEADVLDTILRVRKSQMNDLRFDKYKMDLVYDKVEVLDDKAWITLHENYELYFNCAPTVKNSASVQHIISARKVDGKWRIVKDDYEDTEGIKKRLVNYFFSKPISLEEAKILVISESEGQIAGRLGRLKEIAEGLKNQNTVVLYTGKPIAYAGGAAVRIDSNSNVAPTVVEGRTLIPARFIAESLGAQVEWNESKATAVIRDGKHKIEITMGEKYLLADERKIPLDVPAMTLNDRIMLPLRAVTDAFGKKVFWDDRGLIILSDGEIDKDQYGTVIDQLANFYQILFTKVDFPRIDGSTATYPLTIEMGKELLGLDDVGAKGFLTHNTTHNAYVNLINGEADIIFVTQPSPEELELAAKEGVELEVVPICREGFVFLVNQNNPVKNLTAKQVREIYQGKITNWKTVGGEDNEIIPYQREANSGSQTLMENTVMKGLKLAAPPKETIVYGMGELIDRVADYSNAKNALGYSVYYFATRMYQNRSIKLLSIDGVAPTKQTIQNESYPFTVGYYAVLRKGDTQDENARKLLRWLLSAEGQKIVDRAGLVPVK